MPLAAPAAPRRSSGAALLRIDSATPDLADVAQQRGDPHPLDLLLGKAEAARQPLGVAGHPSGVGRRALATVHRLGQRDQRGEPRAGPLDRDLLGVLAPSAPAVPEDDRAVPPASLASYRARSAACRSSPEVMPCTGKLATPQLTVIFSGSRANAALTSAREPLGEQIALALVGLRREHGELLAAEARDHVAGPGRRARAPAASWTSARSPAACPKRSLNSLNQSRSSTTIDSGRAARVERSSSPANRSSSSRRFARPVSESVRAAARQLRQRAAPSAPQRRHQGADDEQRPRRHRPLQRGDRDIVRGRGARPRSRRRRARGGRRRSAASKK